MLNYFGLIVLAIVAFFCRASAHRFPTDGVEVWFTKHVTSRMWLKLHSVANLLVANFPTEITPVSVVMSVIFYPNNYQLTVNCIRNLELRFSWGRSNNEERSTLSELWALSWAEEHGARIHYRTYVSVHANFCWPPIFLLIIWSSWNQCTPHWRKILAEAFNEVEVDLLKNENRDLLLLLQPCLPGTWSYICPKWCENIRVLQVQMSQKF